MERSRKSIALSVLGRSDGRSHNANYHERTLNTGIHAKLPNQLAPVTRDARWRSGSVYVFGINAATGEAEFSGSASTFAVSGRIAEVLFDGRDAVGASRTFGEAFWYYNFINPATGEVGAKVAFVKLVLAQGVPLLVGSGY